MLIINPVIELSSRTDMTQAIADNATVLREFKHLALVFWHEFNNFKQVIVVIN